MSAGQSQRIEAMDAGETAVLLAKPPRPTAQRARIRRYHEAGALREALDQGHLRVHYQPQIGLSDDRLVGVEALVRWADPGRGLVPPAEFIPLAEATGLIVPIGAWVLEEACRQARRWLDTFPERPALVVSVNVSVRQFGPALVDTVARALTQCALPAGSLCLEVTESLLMADVDAAMGVLAGLATIGVRLSIDDFGTGFSSLAYLKRLPLHELKIDKSFVDGLGRDPQDTAIVAAVIAMAHALDLEVVAEGVETAEQVDRLRVLGCDVVQGYHYARPGEAAAVDALVHAEAAASWIGHPQDVEPDPDAHAFRAERVLVVDDTVEVRQLAAMSLSAKGFDVHQAVDGAEALASARSQCPDCVVLDVSMPGLSGFDVCEALRADAATASCTIVMLTAKDDAEDKARAFSAGADDYIVKPFSPRDLASRVTAALRRRRENLELGDDLS